MKIVIRRPGSDRAKQKTGLKALATAIFAATLMMFAQSAYSGSGSPLEGIGLLTFETGATDRMALYDDGVFQVPTSTNPPDPGGDTADATQPVVDESKNKCEMDQSPGVVGPDPLVIFSQQDGANVGFVGDSTGVFSRGGGGGNARGVKCGRINDDEILIMSLGPHFDLDDDGDLDVAVNRTHVDAEFKHNAIAIFTAKFAGTITGQYYVLSGSNSGGPVPAGLVPGAFEIPCGATGSDSNNDSGPNDNCAIEWPFDYGEAGIAPNALWDQLEMEVRVGAISFEGGGDFSLSFHNRSEFDLVRVDGLLDCQGTFSGGDGIEGARLNNLEGGCGPLVPFSLAFDGNVFKLLYSDPGQNTTFVLYPIWGLEGVDPTPDTLISWAAAVPNWDTCDENSTPNCFVLKSCDEFATPLRFCGESNVACITDKFCEDNADEGDELCLLREMIPPVDPMAVDGVHHGFPAGQYDDLDSTLDNTQYACRCGEETIWVGPVGLDGIPNTEDDTLTAKNFRKECVFINGDIRGRRN